MFGIEFKNSNPSVFKFYQILNFLKKGAPNSTKFKFRAEEFFIIIVDRM